MKLITLNTWGARIRKPFIDFIKKYQDTDIFCFQEVYDKSGEIMGEEYPEVNHDLFTELSELLPNYKGFFRPALQGVYGIAIFIKKDYPVLEEGEILIHARNQEGTINDGHHDRNLQWIKFHWGEQVLTVLNVHGLWNGKGKMDTPERITQSKIIRECMNNIVGSKILCGDFNLNPGTESVKIVEDGMRNLIKDYSIPSTRTSIYYSKPGKTEKFADYIFTSPDISVKDFKVLPEEVSDHAALFLEV
ncbi:MAG: endonuclease/exonuclease/phosphatase family protein [Candidatus Zambryskibacteria bacterium]|nr:endonuclease/exonuclease/phosphatase family protein [Candidatus Zambryskibacteria bacterium]